MWTGIWFGIDLDCHGHLYAATGRQAEAVTAWTAYAALLPREEDWPGNARLRQEPLRAARQVLGPARPRAAEERGAAMGWIVKPPVLLKSALVRPGLPRNEAAQDQILAGLTIAHVS